MPQKMKKYERRILEAIIENADKSIRSKLYCQYKELSVVKREFTGVGFYIYFELPDPSYAIADLTDVPILRLGGIAAEIKGLKHGADFILYVKHGVITMLEG